MPVGHITATFDDQVHQPEGTGVSDGAGQNPTQDGVVHAGEEMNQVALQHVWIAAGEHLAAIQRPVGALAHATGVGIVDEAGLEDRLDDAHQSVVDDAVTEGGGGDDARLGIADGEMGVWARPIGLGQQRLLQTEQVGLQLALKGGHLRLAALAPGSTVEGDAQIPEAANLGIQVLVGLHCITNLRNRRQYLGGCAPQTPPSKQHSALSTQKAGFRNQEAESQGRPPESR